MKILLLCILGCSLMACSSSYTPSEKMLAYKKDMSTEQAQQILQQVIWAAVLGFLLTIAYRRGLAYLTVNGG